MRITLGTTTLCHGASLAPGDFTGPEDLRLELRREVQVRAAIDAEEVTLAARKNAVWALSFAVCAAFESPELALQASQTLAAAISEAGETPDELTLGQGSNATTWSQAIIANFTAEPIGCTLRVAYAITAAKVKLAVSC